MIASDCSKRSTAVCFEDGAFGDAGRVLLIEAGDLCRDVERGECD